MIFQLKKPLYEWRSLGPGQGSDLFLAHSVEQWLEDQQIWYDAYPLPRVEDRGDGPRTYLFFYIDIPDNRKAILFKLTWM